MNNLALTRALRRALVLSLTVPPLAYQASCGGNVVVDGSTTGAGGATSSSSTTTSVTDTSVTTGTGTTTTPCALASTTPTTVIPGGCSEGFPLLGNAATCGVPGGGILPVSQCLILCPPNMMGMPPKSCDVVDGMGTMGATLFCNYAPCATGRRPPGLAPSSARGADPVARFLAATAHLEAASVVAFDRLAGELAAHGAPETLVRAARRSAREEVRHARVTGRLAERAGACPEPVTVTAEAAPRTLEAIAADNAVEGCVRETFGAVVAKRQAEAAGDPEVRRAMETIARDETRHAQLSWERSRWLDGRLDAAARRRVRRERDRAVEGLLRELAAEPHPSLTGDLGLPTASQALAAARDLRASLWS